MRPAHCSILSTYLKRKGAPRRVWYCGPSVATPYTDCMVECEEALNAPRALLVLESIILEREGRPPYSLVGGCSVGTSASRV